MQRRTQLWRLFVGVIKDRRERAVLSDEFRRRLLAYTGHTVEVVAWVATQGRIVGILRGGHASALFDSGFVI